jgi:Ca-activated chloride channel family protein
MDSFLGNLRALFLLPLAPALAVFLWRSLRRRRALLIRFAGAGAGDGESIRGLYRRLRFKALLLTGAAFALIAAYAEPRFGIYQQRLQWRGGEIVVLVDVSRSMLATDVKPSRLERAKLEIKNLLRAAKGDRLALVAFSGTAFIHCPLTVDYDAFAMFLDDLSPTMSPVGGTAIGDAIRKGLEAFSRRGPTRRTLVIITDGEDHGPSAMEAVRQAGRMGVRIVAFGMGDPQGSLIPLSDEEGRLVYLKDNEGRAVKTSLNEPLLIAMAEGTGGSYTSAYSGKMRLDDLYREDFPPRKGKLLESSAKRRYHDRYLWPLALALVLLVFEPMVTEKAGEEKW